MPNKAIDSTGCKPNLNFLSNLDIIGNSLKLNYGDQSKFKTSLGGCTSIILLGLISFFFYDALSRLFDTTAPDVNISNYITSEIDVMDLYKDKFTVVTGGIQGL